VSRRGIIVVDRLLNQPPVTGFTIISSLSALS
jgi:hypothetical protein